ncbi:uncharacterized protein LOC133728333 [Rosa rugosa]|uniref:uncharacterized protein LOC133728333 n=1 Tax=Rosa rugosa TaxID=74645 RepID=UPI002B411826|nr:uncharacterized protein LOC133728333 [Rosa rugosa]
MAHFEFGISWLPFDTTQQFLCNTFIQNSAKGSCSSIYYQIKDTQISVVIATWIQFNPYQFLSTPTMMFYCMFSLKLRKGVDNFIKGCLNSIIHTTIRADNFKNHIFHLILDMMSSVDDRKSASKNRQFIEKVHPRFDNSLKKLVLKLKINVKIPCSLLSFEVLKLVLEKLYSGFFTDKAPIFYNCL